MRKRYEDGIIPKNISVTRQETARQIREARLEVNLTQQVLADRSGTQKSNISRMESGKYNPSLDFLVKVAESMGKQVTIRIE